MSGPGAQGLLALCPLSAFMECPEGLQCLFRTAELSGVEGEADGLLEVLALIWSAGKRVVRWSVLALLVLRDSMVKRDHQKHFP